MKRKDLEDLEVGVPFLYAYSPSSKSRRLDVDSISLIQEDPRISTKQVQGEPLSANPVAQTSPFLPSEEKAIVLYNPATSTPFFKSPSEPGFSIVFDSSLLPGLKGHFFWPGNQRQLPQPKDDTERDETSNNSMAVVPWVAPQVAVWPKPETSISEAMEADEPEAEMMDTEESCDFNNIPKTLNMNGLQMWQQQQPQQQHYTASGLPQNRYATLSL